MTSRRPRSYQPRTHKVTATAGGAEGDWVCKCKATGNGADAARTHYTTAAKRALAKHNTIERAARLIVSAADMQLPGRLAVDLLAHHRTHVEGAAFGPRLIEDDQLVPYIAAGYDHWGMLSLRIQWQELAGALTAGTINGDALDIEVLRLATSVAGRRTPVNLGMLATKAGEDTSKLIAEAMAELFAR